jgi:SAM-dependent methyltransferase
VSENFAADWEARFQAGTTPWQRGELHPALTAWLDGGVLRPGRILVPGAGRSPEPLALAQAGFSVTVVDAAASAVAFQHERLAPHAGSVVEQADLLAWKSDTPFDAVYDQTCLCALPPAVWPGYAARLHAWLRPGGVLAVLFMQTGREGGPPFDCDPAAMRALFDPADWTWPEVLPPTVAHPNLFAEQPAALLRR